MAGKKQNYQKTGAALARKLKRREEAEKRQNQRAARTPQQQLALIKKRRGKSARESARIKKQVDSTQTSV